MADLEHLNGVSGSELTATQIDAILQQIDLDVLNLLREGKLAAAKYTLPGNGPGMDRAANLQALLAARAHYQQLKIAAGSWEVSQGETV